MRIKRVTMTNDWRLGRAVSHPRWPDCPVTKIVTKIVTKTPIMEHGIISPNGMF